MTANAQDQVQLLTVPFDWHLSVTTQDELGLLVVPHGRNMQIKVLSIGFTGRVIVTAATVRAEWRDALLTEDNPDTPLSTTMATFTTSNVTTQRTFNANGAVLATSADVLGTLIEDLRAGLPLPEYTLTNITRALTHDSDANRQALLDDQIAQLITDIVDGRIVDVVFSNTATDRTFDADSTTVLELADIVQNLHDDLTPTVYLHAAANIVNQGLEGYVSLWDGGLIMNQGDALDLEITCTDSTQDGEGYAAIVEYVVLRHSGG